MCDVPPILMVTHSLGLEGAPRCFVIVAKSLAAALSGRVTVFSHVDGPLRKELETAGIPVLLAPDSEISLDLPDSVAGLERYCRENLHFLGLSSLEAWDRNLKAVAEYLLDRIGYKPGIVLANTVLAFWGIALARLWQVPSIWSIHESEPPLSHLDWLPRELFDMLPGLLTHVTRAVFVAKATERVFIEAGHVFSGRVIPLGLPSDMPVFTAERLDRQKTRSALGLADEQFCILALGSVFERKGQTDLCRAMALLPKTTLARMRCHIVGDRPGTPYSRTLHDCVSKLPKGAREAISIFPETADTAPHYRAADVFVMCSRMESYPFVILEAMSIGLPIITTPVFGIREQLTPQDALFYEPEDIAALADHIALLANDAAQRTHLSRKAQERYTTLPSHDEMCMAYHALLSECY